MLRTVAEAGLNFKIPFVQTVHRYERRILTADRAAQEYLTRDRKRVLVDHMTMWRISDPHEFFRRVRTEAQALTRLDDIVTGRLRQEVAQHEFMEKVTADVKVSAQSLGIERVNTRIKRADLPREVQDSIFARMDAERNRIASRYRAEGAERAQEIRRIMKDETSIILGTNSDLLRYLKSGTAPQR